MAFPPAGAGEAYTDPRVGSGRYQRVTPHYAGQQVSIAIGGEAMAVAVDVLLP